MIRTTVIPDNTDVHISIPEDYIGREIEVLYYPLDEITEKKSPIKTMSAFKNLLTVQETDDLQNYVKKSREEWKRDF